jgi:hypothetical protein
MPHEDHLWDRINRTGFGFAAVYVALVVASFAVGKSSPIDLGQNAIPFLLLTLPWSALVQRLSVPGVPWTETVALIAFIAGIVVNTAVIYIIGSEVQAMWSQFWNWHRNRDH